MAQAETRKLAAIMFTDMVGFSRQKGSNEAHTLRLLAVHNQVIQQAVAEHHGTIIKTVGDAFLVDFPSVVHAVQCAQAIQAQFRTHNADKVSTDQIHIRMGIHLGDIVQQDGDVFGDGVNIASRLQTLAEPDTICLSQVVYKEVEKKLSLGTVVSLGRPKLKNIAQREPVYALLAEQPQGIRQRLLVQRLKLTQWRRTGQVMTAMVVLLWVGVVTYRMFYPPSGQPQGGALTKSQSALPLPNKPSIVVLPFDNLSGDPQQDYFSNGITEVLTSDLSRISSLFVIARNTAFAYPKPRNVQEVGKELGVRYVLEGSVQKVALDLGARIAGRFAKRTNAVDDAGHKPCYASVKRGLAPRRCLCLLEGDILLLEPGRHIPGSGPALGDDERVSRAEFLSAPASIRDEQMSLEHQAVFVMRIGVGFEDAGSALPESDGELLVFGSVPNRARIRAVEGASVRDDHFTWVFRTLCRRRITIDSRDLLPACLRASGDAEDTDQRERADHASCDVTSG
jgi:class 3 adenylate cyclase/TolB-like protein